MLVVYLHKEFSEGWNAIPEMCLYTDMLITILCSPTEVEVTEIKTDKMLK